MKWVIDRQANKQYQIPKFVSKNGIKSNYSNGKFLYYVLPIKPQKPQTPCEKVINLLSRNVSKLNLWCNLQVKFGAVCPQAVDNGDNNGSLSNSSNIDGTVLLQPMAQQHGHRSCHNTQTQGMAQVPYTGLLSTVDGHRESLQWTCWAWIECIWITI